MSDFSEKMAELLRQLEAGEITPSRFEDKSAQLIGLVGKPQETEPDSLRREEVEVAAKMLREL